MGLAQRTQAEIRPTTAAALFPGSFHALRHAFATTAVAVPPSDAAVAKGMGHRVKATAVDLYGHLRDVDFRSVTDAVAADLAAARPDPALGVTWGSNPLRPFEISSIVAVQRPRQCARRDSNPQPAGYSRGCPGIPPRPRIVLRTMFWDGSARVVRSGTVVKLWSTLELTGGLSRVDESTRRESANRMRFEVANGRVSGATGQDLGDELRRQAESLAYKAAQDYELALHRIEMQLVAATDKDSRFSESVKSMTFWVQR